jgi:glutamate racemase
MDSIHPIGIFDSGFGGLTVLREIERLLPSYDYLYLGDNARAPYGNRSFETGYDVSQKGANWPINIYFPLWLQPSWGRNIAIEPSSFM